MLAKGKTIEESACKAHMSEKSARKYRNSGKLPSEMRADHTWCTRTDPFADDWPEIQRFLETDASLEALTLFDYLQRKYPGRYQDGQLRTLQRKVKRWRSLEGPPKDVIFPQIHEPGRLSQSDFTHMNDLRITINHAPFDHMLYHYILSKSNWETASICFSESFESLSEGFQEAVWNLGAVPQLHQTDCLSAAVNIEGNPEAFTSRYRELMNHYRIKPMKINPGKANENGDVEQSHYRFKKAVDQELMLCGSRNFSSRAEYEQFLRKLLKRRNAGRKKSLELELASMRPLPSRKLDSFSVLLVRVRHWSTILVHRNTYSVNSRLIGEMVRVKLYAEYLEVWYAQKLVERLPRLRGEKKHYIQYRHIIDSLIRKPGAFERYAYKKDMFPSTRFRMVYDGLMEARTSRVAAKEYLQVLNLAAKGSESLVDEAIRVLQQAGRKFIDAQAVEHTYEKLREANAPKNPETKVTPANLTDYHELFRNQEASWITNNCTVPCAI